MMIRDHYNHREFDHQAWLERSFPRAHAAAAWSEVDRATTTLMPQAHARATTLMPQAHARATPSLRPPHLVPVGTPKATARCRAAARISGSIATGPPSAIALIASWAASSTMLPTWMACAGVRWKTRTP